MGVGAAPPRLVVTGVEVVTTGVPGVPGPPPPTAQARPAEPITAAVASTATGPWLRVALCRPIVEVFHSGCTPGLVAAWAGERAAEAGRQPGPRDDRRVPRLRQGGLGAPAQRGQRPGPRRGPGRRAPGRAQRRVPEAAADRPCRRPEGAQQRHRLRVPPAHGVRLAHRPRRRPRAGRRARARAGRGRRRHGIRARGRALLPPARRPRQRRVLRRRPLRRVLGRRPPDPGRRRARARADRPPHRRARRGCGQGCR